MARFLINFLFFAFPFVAFWLFMLVSRRMEDRPDLTWGDAPFGWLVVVGLALGIGSTVLLGYYSGEGVEASYNPAALVDGQIE